MAVELPSQQVQQPPTQRFEVVARLLRTRVLLGGQQPGISHLLHGHVDTHAIAWLLVGSIPGVLIGSHLSIKVPERSLRIVFGFVLCLSGIKLVGVPHANTVIVVMLGVGATALVGWGARVLHLRRAAAASSA